MKNAIEPKIETHGVVWRDEECVDAGIFRATSTYTNSEAGYDKDYYGVRKYVGLKPNHVYSVTIQGSTGNTDEIFAAREWEDWEYGTNEDVDYLGLKLVSDDRNANDKYGFSVSSTDNVLAVGCPGFTSFDEEGYQLNNAGKVDIYERADQNDPGEKAPWVFKQILELPDGFRRDYFEQLDTGGISFPGFPTIPDRQWNIGQEGRELGYSVATHSGERDVIVVGGPGSDWSRTFDDIETEKVTVGVMIITDEFSFDSKKANQLQAKIRYWNKLYRYYASDPSNMELRIVICQPTGIFTAVEQNNLPSYMYHNLVNRNNTGASSAEMLQQLQNAFLEAFPNDPSARNNGIPPILGIYVDDSGSLGREAMEPAIDDFISYYESYTLANGVEDIFGNPLSGHIYEFIPAATGSGAIGEDWFTMSNFIIDETLDYERLIEEDSLKFITEDVGEEYAPIDSVEFNLDPRRGGRVYVFEKENGEFNLVQEIKSVNELNLTSSDRFGHDVAISKNGEAICVGSPYASDCISVFEVNENAKSDLYENIRPWLVEQNSLNPGQYSSLIDTYDGYRDTMSIYESGEKLYLEDLDKTDKFQARLDLDVEEYVQVFSYSHGDIPYVGTWGFIPQKFAGSPRLGYSVDINEDGSTIIAGSPTDSFNEFDDYNVWYKNDGYQGSGTLPNEGMWASNVNGGSARIFDSRKYYEHDKAVEFTKFGNLGRSLNTNPGHYDDLGDILTVPYEKTEFADLEIPKDAGLAFIITPEVDAASDEIIENIKNWLELGDRTLVLVGDDPTWEENGAYSTSNEIINKILEKLDSRMRITSARYKHESLQDCAESGRPNALNSGLPFGARDSLSLNRQDMYCKGVGDIKIHMPGYLEKSPCDNANSKCEMWLQDQGDLRAAWTEQCTNERGEVIKYTKNWPLQFGSYDPGCFPAYQPSIRRPNEEPLPVMVAGEYLPERTEIIPASSGVRIKREKVFVTETTTATSLRFADEHNEPVVSFWSEEDGSISADSNGNFFNPDEFDGRNAVAQATSELLEVSPQREERIVESEFPIVAKEVVGDSEVYIIASLFPENESNLTEGNDENVNFYLNLVQQDCSTKGRIIQLGGWTGRESFADAYSASLLYKLFSVTGNVTQENWTNPIPESYNVCWLANVDGLPSPSEVQEIQDWLATGNKKLVITYGSDVSSVNKAKNLMELLGLNSKPLFSEANDQYVASERQGFIFSDDISVAGCGSREVTRFSYGEYASFIPVVGGQEVVYQNGSYKEFYYVPRSKHFVKTGIIELSVPVNPDSGYRVVVKTVSETPQENRPLTFHVSGAYNSPVSRGSSEGYAIPDFDGDNLIASDKQANSSEEILYGQNGVIVETSMDVRSFTESEEISIFIEGNEIIEPEEYAPRTLRVLSVEVYKLDIEEVNRTISRQVFSHYNITEIPYEIPEQIVVYPEVLRPIHSDNTKYCSFYEGYDDSPCKEKSGKEIADGPVIIAEEPEHFSSFSNGSKRSSIVLIADSSIVQGDCDHYRNSNAHFLNSLYPESPVVDSSLGTVRGRVFEYSQKLMPPQAFSPAKIRSIKALGSPISEKFDTGESQSNASSNNFYDGYSSFHPNDVMRPEDPPEENIQLEIEKFKTQIGIHGEINPRFNFNGYDDAGLGGGMPRIVDAERVDYFDIDSYPSGYPGGLFGYSVSISNDLICVGSPYSGFYEGYKTWNEIKVNPSVFDVNEDGGYGEIYCFKKTNNGINAVTEALPWELTDKISPQSQLNDLFGYDVDLDVEFMVVGAPNHNYDTLHIHNFEDGEFIRKEFDYSFDIPTHEVYDLGDEDTRTVTGSGVLYDNIGAVYTYEYGINDWYSRSKSWTFAEKLNAERYNNREDDDNFGRSVSMNRSYRRDSDYTLSVGSPIHDFGLSVSDAELSNAGAAYVYDAMLRRQPPVSNLGGEITATVGLTGENGNERDSVTLEITQNISGDPKVFQATGLVATNEDGEIFLEVNGSENAERGFIVHRPYIQWVNGKLVSGDPATGNFPIFTEGAPNYGQDQINLYAESQESDIVYNTLEMVVNSANLDNDSMSLYVNSVAPIADNESINLVCGSGALTTNDTLNLRVRGK